MKQECYVVQITIPIKGDQLYSELKNAVEQLKGRFPGSFLHSCDGEDISKAHGVNVSVIYLPSENYPDSKVRPYSLEEIKSETNGWIESQINKHPEQDRPSVLAYRLTRAIIPWTPPVVVEGPIAMREAIAYLDELEAELETSPNRKKVGMLRQLLIPTK